MKTLQDLFLDELGDIYDAEHRLTKALPKMVKAATHEELRSAFEAHLEETEDQARNLEEVFECFGDTAKGKKCKAIVGLIEEADEIISDNKGEQTINAALISAAQKVEHYEIASYGCLREWAEQLGNDRAAQILEEILEEEKAADEKLTVLARQCCNHTAQDGDQAEQSDGFRRGVRPSPAQIRMDEEND
jgi:ferritin-like metal-binding protein YciE